MELQDSKCWVYFLVGFDLAHSKPTIFETLFCALELPNSKGSVQNLIVNLQELKMLSKLKDAGMRVAVKGPRYIKALFMDPRWAATFILGRFHCLRQLSRRLSKPAAKTDFGTSRLFGDLDATKIVDEIREQGMCNAFRLPKDTLESIHHYAQTATAIANENPENSFVMSGKAEAEARMGKTIVVGNYPNIDKCLSVDALIKDPLLHEVASKYIGSEVKSSCRMWWSFPVNASREDRLRFAQGTFHYDPDVDFRALKFFFCLTDTDENSGLHEVVVGSHKRKRMKHIWTLFVGQSDEEIQEYYGTENIKKMACDAGQGFAEDPLCFHKGNAPIDNPRLMLEVLFVPERNTKKATQQSLSYEAVGKPAS
ncbi:MAG: hypothetical protein ACI87E_004020 [Mariniblastus sp.]|jgi:hypothetical protein